MMTAHWNPIDEQKLFNAQERADAVIRQFDPRGAPAPLNGENLILYRKRMADRLKQYSPQHQGVNVYEASNTAFDHIENEIYEGAAKEARFPTQIAEGELKQVTRHDASGRPFYEWYGSPMAWMPEFTRPKKRLVGIRTQTETGFRPGNMG
jgi:hypothetical protein